MKSCVTGDRAGALIWMEMNGADRAFVYAGLGVQCAARFFLKIIYFRMWFEVNCIYTNQEKLGTGNKFSMPDGHIVEVHTLASWLHSCTSDTIRTGVGCGH